MSPNFTFRNISSLPLLTFSYMTASLRNEATQRWYQNQPAPSTAGKAADKPGLRVLAERVGVNARQQALQIRQRLEHLAHLVSQLH